MATSLSTGLHVLEFLFACLLLFIIVVGLMSALIVHDAKQSVDNTPKVPMTMCDKHGLYPTSAALDVTAIADNRPDLPVHICPFCFDDRLKAAQKKMETMQ